MSSLEIVGPFRGLTGYDRYTREFTRAFVRAGLRVRLTALDGWSIDVPDELREHWFDTLTVPVDAASVLHFAMPHQAWPWAGRHNVNYTMFEADRIPAAWVEHATDHDRIVVPTQSSLEAWVRSGVPAEQLRVCPLGVGDFFAAPAKALPLADTAGRPVSSYRYRFLNIADLRPRKNHLGLLRAWIMGTDTRDDAILIIKLTAFDAIVLDQFRADVAAMQARLGCTLAEAAPVLIVANLLSDQQLRGLLRSATHYISMSKGEGWDLVMLEAGVAGLQLIAPSHSAYTAYLCEDEAELIPARLVPALFEGQIAREDQVLFESACWWQPDEQAAAALIGRIIRGDVALKRSPRERLLAQYSWAAAARRLLELLDELG
jgi:glycosyltransferase involved in cell wall biosynthesis